MVSTSDSSIIGLWHHQVVNTLYSALQGLDRHGAESHPSGGQTDRAPVNIVISVQYIVPAPLMYSRKLKFAGLKK